jgi:uncharacterized protein YggU (UPF0235/DUF167 family)
MARPKADWPPAEQIRALADSAGRMKVHVTPGARSEALTIETGRLAVKVRARPADGAANVAVLGLLAAALGVSGSAVRLLRGATSREKLVQIPPL